jgi:hypothetical protein
VLHPHPSSAKEFCIPEADMTDPFMPLKPAHSGAASEPLDPRIQAILASLAEAYRQGLDVSVARLREELDLPLHVVMRTVSALIDANFVELKRQSGQNPAASLTAAGAAFVHQQRGPSLEALRKAVR